MGTAVRGLEERLGVRLLARTTRSVAPTDAGEQLISRLRPALGEVEAVLDQIVDLRDRPTGRVRLLVTPLSAAMVLAPKLVPLPAVARSAKVGSINGLSASVGKPNFPKKFRD
jgi:DNA-binding transcriptional LysR family regulator